MRRLAICMLLLLLAGAVSANPPPPQEADPISLDRQSPSVVFFGNWPADIYGEAVGGGIGGWDVGGPGPVLHISDFTYGLTFLDNVDDISLGHNNPNAQPTVYFSATRNSRGTWNTQYRHQANRNQAAGDRFVTNGWMNLSPAQSYALGIPANLVLWMPGFGSNLLSANQTWYNEIPTIPPPAMNPVMDPMQIDDMDALELHPIDTTGDHVHDMPLYFSLDPTSPSILPGCSAATIFVSLPGAPGLVIYAQPAMMGLADTDDIDALVVCHLSADPTIPLPYMDYALFSLRPGNSLGASPSDVFVTTFLGTCSLYIQPQTLGLRAQDDLDALDIEFGAEGPAQPQVFDELLDEPAEPPIALSSARNNPDGTLVNVSGIVTLIGSGFIYIEEPTRASGIRVASSPPYVSIGDDLQVIGHLQTVDGERVIMPTQPVSELSSENRLPGALGMRTRDVGGGPASFFDVSITNGRGAFNVGLRVNIVGMVTAVDPSPAQEWFYAWDGSNGRMGPDTVGPLDDGTGNNGVRVEASSIGLVPNMDWVEIDGVVSTDAAIVPGSVIPVIIPRVYDKKTDFEPTTDWVPWSEMYPGESGVEADYWNLIGLPASPRNWDPTPIFGPYDPSLGNLWRWEAATESFIVYDPWTSAFGGMLLGDGYWLDADSDWDVIYGSTPRTEDQWVTLPLGTGKWSLIGHTFDHNTWWTDVQVHDGDEVKDMRTAATDGWLSSTGWWLDNTSGSFRTLDVPEGFPTSCKLLVWHGYYLQSNTPQISLIIPARPEATADPYSSPPEDCELGLYQLDWDYQGQIINDSEWGEVELSFIGNPSILYFNLAVNGNWQIRNIPVLSVEGDGVPQTMAYNFNLGVPRGTDVSSLNYGYSLTLATIPAMPGGANPATVYARSAVMYSGLQGGGQGQVLPGAQPMVGGPVFTSACHKHRPGFPNQPCGVNECVPAAVSNSLQWLNSQYNLGMSAAHTSIAAMKTATNWTSSGAPTNWYDYKIMFMKLFGYPVTTTTVSVDQIDDQLEAGQDVEITSIDPAGDNRRGHCAAVVGCSYLGGGKYSIDIAHDKKQGKPGGTTTQTTVYDANTNGFAGGAGFNGRALSSVVVECPKKS